MKFAYHVTMGLLAVAAILIAAPAVAQTQDSASSQDQAASVNGSLISKQALEAELARMKQQVPTKVKTLPPGQLEAMRTRALDTLIDRELLFQASQKKGIEITPETVTTQLEMLKGRFPDAATFEKALADLMLTETIIRENIAKELAIKSFLDAEIGTKITVTEEELRTFYDSHPDVFQRPEQIQASHILIKSEPGADASEKTKATTKIKEIQNKLAQGADFSELAKTHSEGPSAPKGGDLGTFGRGQMVKPFETAAFALDVDQVSDIVQTRFGYHLIKVTAKHPAETVAYETAKERISGYLKQQKAKLEIDKYLGTLRESAEIKKF